MVLVCSCVCRNETCASMLLSSSPNCVKTKGIIIKNPDNIILISNIYAKNIATHFGNFKRINIATTISMAAEITYDATIKYTSSSD